MIDFIEGGNGGNYSNGGKGGENVVSAGSSSGKTLSPTGQPPPAMDSGEELKRDSGDVGKSSGKSRRELGLPLSLFCSGVEESGERGGERSNKTTMDLEGGRHKTNTGIGYHGRCADPDDPDLPPHLSEYMEQNVIAVLNRCDPERYRRCYSCGYDNTSSSADSSKNGFSSASNADSPCNNPAGGNNSSAGNNLVNYYWSQPTYGYSGYDYGWTNAYPPGYYQNIYYPPNQNHTHHHHENTESDNPVVGSTHPDDFGVNDMDEEEIFTFDARLLSEAFLSSGRIDHTIQLMAYHPDYLEIFLRTHHFLLRGDGPLPYHHRNYIAIMAAARYQCSYLMELQKREFLFQGGDPKWLRGLEAAPAKLTSLYNINKMMAHRPWVLKKEDFLHLTKKAGWSLSEVVQAVVLLAHFHSLSSFIHGCGITPEIDFDKGHTYLDPNTFNMFGSSTSSPIGGMLEGGLGVPGSPQTPSPDPTNKMTHCSPLKKCSELSSSVSFAADPTATFPPPSIFANASSDMVKAKPTKSILKKTDVGIVTTPTANNHSNHLNSSSSTGSLNSSNTSLTAPSSNLLKPATHHNSLSGATSPSKKPLPSSSVSEVDTIMATMKNLSETSPIEDPEERKKRFEKVASCDDTHEKENVLASNQSHVSSLPPEVSPFVCDPEFTYEDFAKRGHVAEMHTFRIQDYSWEEHGFSLVNRLYADVGGYIDEKFKVAQNMTYYTMGGRAHVDTTKFRTAVWNYIQCLYGIRHDDYDYGEVNQLLERPLKSYIKTVCCYPERVTKADYDNVMREFKHSEKVHVNLMIMEAKIQAELLYALRTIMRFIL
jgi:sestrin